jgi:hypothetical protein
MTVSMLLCLGASLCGSAQEVTATIVGLVTDPGGAVVVGARVNVTDIDKKVQVRSVVTDGHGEFVANLLPVGHYSVRVMRSGFKTDVRSGIELHAGDRVSLPVVLSAGDVQQEVTVTADALHVQSQTSASDELISGAEVRELSINNRNFLGLLAILPGVTNTSSSDELTIGAVNPTGSVNSLSFSLNGGRVSANSFLLDGADDLDRGANTTLINTPSVDAIQEFKAIRGVYSAEYGRNAAAQINIITRSGDSMYHGTVYEFFRNDDLNANNALNKLNHIPRPPLRYNDFGGTFGGPFFIPNHYNVARDKTFFFVSEEVRRVIEYPTQAGGLAPTAAMEAGTFTKPVCIKYTTAAGTTCAAGATATSIPSTSFSPIAQEYLTDIFEKLPTGAAEGTTNALQLVSVGRSVYNLHQEFVRIDHILSSRESLTFRYIRDAANTVEPYGYQVNSLLPLVSTTASQSPGGNAMIRLTSVLRSNLLNEVAFAYTTGRKYSVPTGLLAKSNATDVKVALPFASTVSNVPYLSISGISGVKGYGAYDNYSRNYNAFDNLTWVLGRHALKFGMTYNYYEKTENNASTNAGSFAFAATTLATGGIATEQTFANFLLGTNATFTQTSLDLTPDIRQNESEYYAQDDFRWYPRLTINAGLRYSMFRIPYDDRDMLSNFDPAKFVVANIPTISAAGSTIVPGTGDPLNGIIVNNATSPFGSKVSNEPGGRFSPRLGFAYSPFHSGKSVLRGGYGLVFDSTLVGIYENNIFANPPYLNNLSVPNTTFANPANGAATTSIPALHGTPLPATLPYTQQYSLDVQQQIGASFLLDVGYYGSKGTHLLGIADINTLRPGQYDADTGGTNATALSTGTTPLVNRYRPYPGYTAINAVENWFGSNYNSLQVSAQKRMSAGGTLRLAYTWQKTMTDSSSDRNNAPQDHFNIHEEYAVANFNRKQILVLSYVYKLPFFLSQRGFVHHAFSGWEFAGTTSFDAGLATQVTSGSGQDPAQLGVLGTGSAVTLRPDRIGNPNANAPHTLLKWFDTSAYAEVPANALRVGNSKPTSLIGPGYQQWDVSMFRNVVFSPRWSLQVRAESFNMFNHTNPQGLFTSTEVVGSSAFGAVSSVREPRRIQLGAKLLF